MAPQNHTKLFPFPHSPAHGTHHRDQNHGRNRPHVRSNIPFDGEKAHIPARAAAQQPQRPPEVLVVMASTAAPAESEIGCGAGLSPRNVAGPAALCLPSFYPRGGVGRSHLVHARVLPS